MRDVFLRKEPSLGPLIWSNWKDGDDSGFDDDNDNDDYDGNDDHDDDDDDDDINNDDDDDGDDDDQVDDNDNNSYLRVIDRGVVELRNKILGRPSNSVLVYVTGPFV